MACALTQGYNLDCRDSYGGIKTVYLMEYDNATTITQSASVVTGITKATGKQFRKYNLIALTGDVEQTITPNREYGTLEVMQTLRFPINKQTTSVRNEILLLAQNRLLAVVIDSNGKNWLLGFDFGIMLGGSSAKTGVTLADRNGFELVFEGKEKALALEVDASTLATLETPGA